MAISVGKADIASLAPPFRALIEGQQAALETLRAENAALSDRSRRLEDQDSAAVVENLRAEFASLTEQNRRLEHLLRALRRAMYGKKSEKLHPDQLLLAFEELEGALANPPASCRQATPPAHHIRAHSARLGVSYTNSSACCAPSPSLSARLRTLRRRR